VTCALSRMQRAHPRGKPVIELRLPRRRLLTERRQAALRREQALAHARSAVQRAPCPAAQRAGAALRGAARRRRLVGRRLAPAPPRHRSSITSAGPCDHGEPLVRPRAGGVGTLTSS